MNTLRIALAIFIASSASARLYGADSKPTSSKTDWRIPSNDAVSRGIDWLLVQHPDDSQGPGHVNLEAAIGEHHSYEIAWDYYTKMLGLDPTYPPKQIRQVQKTPGRNRHFVKESTNDKGRFTIMGGQIGKYKLTMYLWVDEANSSKKDRVYVKMLFCP